jgi:general secretion pathway protein D
MAMCCAPSFGAPALADPADPIPIPATPAIARATDPTAGLDSSPAGTGQNRDVQATILPGTSPAPIVAKPVSVSAQNGDFSLNFPNADVAVVAKAVLGDLLHRSYTLAQGVGGNVTLVTPHPVAKSALLPLLETALKNANLALSPVAGGFEIEPANNAREPIAPGTFGHGSEIITLRFVNADEVRKLLDNVLPGVVTATDAATGTITIAGTTGQRDSARDLLHQFDVDWLRNTSFALFVPQRTDSRLIVPSLDKLINAPDSPTHGLVRLIAMEQINGILAISIQPQYLADVRRWVEILDREGESAEKRIFVYHAQNGRAKDLTRTINAAFGAGGGGGSSAASSDPFAPTEPSAASNGMVRSATTAPAPNGAGRAEAGAQGNAASGVPMAHIISDDINNAVIVFGTPREYAVIEDALRKLDLPAQQVLIEAAITEVSLTDDLRYGVQWNYQNGINTAGYSEGTAAAGAVSQIFPGFSYFYGGSNIQATLNALQQHTKVKVVSAPKLLVLNNQTAALQVGDQVPISTGSASTLTGNASNVVSSTIEYRDTGVILKITPRVNASGMVQLDVSQEVSEVNNPGAGAAATQSQSPTISTRRISTTVQVQDGQVIALGGLFSNTKTVTRNGIPLLSQIPIIGSAFGTHVTNDSRTELIILLKPHVLVTEDDARNVTDELRAKLRALQPFVRRGQIQ